MYDTASELYNDLFETYFDEYNDLSDAKRSKIDPNYDPANLTLDEYYYSEQYKEKSVEEKELDDLPPLEGAEEEVKERKGLTILTPNKLLTRPPILLARIKAGNNSYK